MLVYFGDVNFQLVDKSHYSYRKVKFFGKDKILKIHVFYVSRLAMIDKFKSSIEYRQWITSTISSSNSTK